MKPAPFEYQAPATLREAIDLLVSDPEATVIAGGQSLIPLLAFRLAMPSMLVDLCRVPGLGDIAVGDGGVRLGARVRWRDIEDDRRLEIAHPLLREAIAHVAHYQIRNRGTVGGSLAHADPAAELPGVAVTCDAEITLVGAAGARTMCAGDFFTGPLSTVRQPDEIVTQLHLPSWPRDRRWAFQEFAQRQGDFALAGIALFYDDDQHGEVSNAHVGVIGACDRAQRLTEVETVLNGHPIDDGLIRQAAATAAQTVDPPEDFHASAAYRRALVATLVDRGLRAGAASGRVMRVNFQLNGEPVEIDVEPRMHLADCLRDELRQTGTHLGCEHGVCGACTVIVDGAAIRACLMLAVQAEGSTVVTVEGLSTEDALSPLQTAFRKHHALQCGFCTPGMLTTAHALLTEEPDADADRIRAALSGNLCRCTGYIGIVEAVLEARAAYRKTDQRTDKP